LVCGIAPVYLGMGVLLVMLPRRSPDEVAGARVVRQVARLLETGDEYTARKAAARLGAMTSARAADALRQYGRETARFVRGSPPSCGS
jgi:hypothetical protein